MGAMEIQVQQCITAIERRCDTLRDEGYCPGVVLSALSIHMGSMAGLMAAMSASEARSFLDGLFERCRANADDQLDRCLKGGGPGA